MASTIAQTLNWYSRFEHILDYTLGSADANELCKRLVHGTYSWGEVKGAYLYFLDNRSNLLHLAGYGMPYVDDLALISIWDDSLAAKCIREKQVAFDHEADRLVAGLPLIIDGIPNGCLVLLMSSDTEIEKDVQCLAPFLSKLGGYFLERQLKRSVANPINREITPIATSRSLTANGTIDELTTRQLQILALMADGLTNAEIAIRVLLSESTVRQETIRIYRALNVGSRIEATAKSRALGLIPAFGITPPPRN